MLDVSKEIERHGLGESPIRVMQNVRDSIDTNPKPLARAIEMVRLMTGQERQYDDIQFARFVAMKCGEEAMKLKGQIPDPEAFLVDIEASTKAFLESPKNGWLFVKATAVIPTEQKEVVEGLDVKVAVKKDGSIKKGGKQVLAAELYKKHVLEAAKPATNQEFIKVLEKELGMSKAGATTYAYNCKKQLGEPEGGLVKAKKGRKAK